MHLAMIKGFEHKGFQAFFETGSNAGIQPHQAPKLARLLARLHAAKVPEDINVPGWRLRPLDQLHQWHIKIEGWMLAQVGIKQPNQAEAAPGLRVVAN